jgi:hypothetical protein
MNKPWRLLAIIPEVETEQERLEITPSGRRAVTDGLPPESVLMLEVMKRLGEVEEQALYDVLDSLVEEFGSAENAAVAVKSGRVGFEEA